MRRPDLLNPLFQEITALPGIGPRNGKVLAKLAGGERVRDLLWLAPVGVIDRRPGPPLDRAEPDQVVTVAVRVHGHETGGPGRPWRIRVGDDHGDMDLVFFHAKGDWLTRRLPVGAWRAVSGRLERFHDRLQMIHPDIIAPVADLDSLRRVEPVYPLAAGITGKAVRTAVAAALETLPDLPEWLAERPREWPREWPEWATAVRTLHAPDDAEAVTDGAARRRLAFDELLAAQIALALLRQHHRSQGGRARPGTGALTGRLRAALPFRLTEAQEAVLTEIGADLAAPAAMLRLLQGDVGAGKSVIAFLAMLQAVESGSQAVLMAPTALLARQHAATFRTWLKAMDLDLPVAVLTGRERGRAAVLAGLAEGHTPLAVGTHALFQEDVAFADLGLAVIDEQHRFGVHQRLLLTEKGRHPDVLVMTATPIPRTLTLAAYGDLDVSRLTGKPPGRKPVATSVLAGTRLDEVIAAVARALAAGRRIYWICPMVEDNETVDLAAATARHADLTRHFGDRVGLVHGRQRAEDRDAAMAAFQAGTTDLLVATTVVEVGVDVPEASVMVIEHAERFGLAQLHQLRGRIGRGADAANCLLLYGPEVSAAGLLRLKVLRDTDDGFEIAEQDLHLRGAGEVLGTRQSGLPRFRLADLDAHEALLAEARHAARTLLTEDPDLTGPRGSAARILLHLFGQDAAARWLRSG